MMFKGFVLAAMVLLIAVLFLASAAPAASASDLTIPLDKRVLMSNNLTVNLLYIIVSDKTYGGAYSPDPVNSSWPVLVYKYENFGDHQAPGMLHAKFVDDNDNVYEKTNPSIENIFPNSQHQPEMMEVAIPKDRSLAKLIIVDDLNRSHIEIPLTGERHTPAGSLTDQVLSEDISWSNLCSLMLIPLIIAGIALLGWIMYKR